MGNVNNPAHYGGADNVYEAIKVIEAWDLGFNIGNTAKYISRAGKKSDNSTLQDLRKAAWYLNREIENLKKHADAFGFVLEQPELVGVAMDSEIMAVIVKVIANIWLGNRPSAIANEIIKAMIEHENK